MIDATDPAAAVPLRLVGLEAARAVHGAAADRLPELLALGDPLADAVIAELDTLGAEGRRLLTQGLEDGLASLQDPPPGVSALLASLEDVPEWVAPEDLADGDRATQAIPQPWDVIVFAAASMVHVYASPAIAKLLMHTGTLVSDAAARRLAETGAWRSAAVLPGGLHRGAPGYVRTAQVRLMHARVRAKALRDGWNTGDWGIPVNQADIARTWLAFTIVPFRCLETLGIPLSEAEERHLYRYWRYIGHLLGLDDAIIAPITTHAEASTLLDLLDTTTATPDTDSRALTTALLEAVAAALSRTPDPTMPPTTWHDLLRATTRAAHGPTLAEALGIPTTPLDDLLPLIAQGHATARRIHLRNPEEAEIARQRHIAVRRRLTAQG